MTRIRIVLLLAFLILSSVYATPPIDHLEDTFPKIDHYSNDSGLLEYADLPNTQQKYPEAIKLYNLVLEQNPKYLERIFKQIALSHSTLDNLEESLAYLEKSLQAQFDTESIKDEAFSAGRVPYKPRGLEDKYTPNLTIWSFLYLYVALIGFYTSIVLNFNKRIELVARVLISTFIFIHSCFILNICFNITNYQYIFPHSYLMSTSFSFLYGPLLYFYFKRISQQYEFTKRDLLHLFPTVLFLFYILPIYTMSAEEKLSLMLGRAVDGQVATDSAYLYWIVGLKLASLIIYGFFTRRMYLKSMKSKELSKSTKLWQRNIYLIHASYIVVYAIYGVVISNEIASGFFYHSQIVCMSAMVLFLGFSANIQPDVFSGSFSIENNIFFKYEKSGLTQSFSEELKASLMNLFDVEKVYRENDLNLQVLSERLNTTRHNTSQVINEHFSMNFHELINKYRIREAKYILDSDSKRNLNIIDVAYEVGFNNKVTFNKAFKKDTQLTPSQYQRR